MDALTDDTRRWSDARVESLYLRWAGRMRQCDDPLDGPGDDLLHAAAVEWTRRMTFQEEDGKR